MNFDFNEFQQFLAAHPDMTYVVKSKCHCPLAIWLTHKLDTVVEVEPGCVRIHSVMFTIPMWMKVYINRFDVLTNTRRHSASEALYEANQLVRDLVCGE